MECLKAIWVRWWGPPYSYFFDFGGEFDSQAMEEHCRAHSVEMLAAPRRAHHMHGFTERHGYLLKVLIVRILLDDGTIEFEVVVEEAVKQKMTIKERAAEAAAPKAMEMEGFGDDSD